MSTHDTRSIDEVIFDISFSFGHCMNGFPQSGALMDMIDGSRGLKDKIIEWAQEFDAAWWQRPEDEREDYLADIDDFADKKWRELLDELKRFNPATGGVRDVVVGVQVVPYAEVAGGSIDPQFDGPDEFTAGWGIYFRLKDGTAQHVADVAGASKYETAMLMGRCLAIEHKVQIEPQPWIVPAAPEMEYRVMWEIDVLATSPREAAEKAWELQKDVGSTATVFDVRRPNSKSSQIDLSVPA